MPQAKLPPPPSYPDLLQRLAQLPWAELEAAYGTSETVGSQLATLCQASDEPARAEALEQLGRQLYHQGSTYPASAAALPFLVELARLAQDEAWRGRLLRLVEELAVLPRTSYLECQEEEEEDVLQCVAALQRSAPHLLALLGADSTTSKLAAIRCLAGVFDDQVVAGALQEQLTAADPQLRAASLVALGNLAALTEDAVQAALEDERLLVRLAAAYALGLAGEEDAPPQVSQVLLEALARRAELEEAFSTLPLVEDNYVAELTNLLTVFELEEHRPQVISALLDELKRLRGLAATGLVQAALGFVLSGPEPEPEQEPEQPAGLSDEQRRILQALVDKDDLWLEESGETLRNLDLLELLEAYELPESREELAELLGGD